LDYHQSSVQVCVMDAAARVTLSRRCANDVGAVSSALAEAGAVSRIGIEACEGTADFAEALSEAGGWSVQLAHPAYVAKMKGSPDKSDFTDARLLADLSRVGYLPRVWLPPREVRELRQVVNHRQRLVDDRRSLKLRVGAALRQTRARPDTKAGRWTKAWVAAVRALPLTPAERWLVEELLDELGHVSRRVARAEAQLRRLTADDATVAKLRTLEGVGEVTAWSLRASIGRFDRFKNAKQLCRYCGLSPRNTASGQRQTQAGLVQAADRRLRATLIQAAHRLVRTVPRWRALAARLVGAGKPKSVAIAAVANRWMRTVHRRMTATPS